MHDVFISYVEEDGVVARQLAAGLESAGFGVWYYERDSIPGLSYLQQTRRAIGECSYFLLVISPDTLQKSNQVDKEVVHAHETAKRFIPVLRGISFVDFRNRQPEWHQAIGAVVSVNVPDDGVSAIVPRIVAGLRTLAADGSPTAPLERPARAVFPSSPRSTPHRRPPGDDRAGLSSAEQSLPLPFPIAYTHYLIGASRDAATRRRRLVHCCRTVVRYCAAVLISDYLAGPCLDEQINHRLHAFFGIEAPSTKDWCSAAQVVTASLKDAANGSLVPELGALIAPGVVPASEQSRQSDRDWADALDAIENGSSDAGERARERSESLDRLIERLSVLSQATLYVPCPGPDPAVMADALVLAGPYVPVQMVSGLNLPYSSEVVRQVQPELTPLLVSRRSPARQLLISPLTCFANIGGVEDLYLLSAIRRDGPTVRELEYQACRPDAPELRIAAGSPYEALLDQAQAIDARLRTAASPPGIRSAHPAAGPLPRYFAMQRAVIEEQTRRFVGRAGVERALDAFLASRPRGYFLLRGSPGQGKTAVACHLIRRGSLVHHLVSRTGGRNDPRLILQSLLAQLGTRCRAPVAIPDRLSETAKAFEDALAAAASNEPLVIVIDGLDELPAEVAADAPFLVTEGLPDRVYFVVTSRPGESLDQLRERLYAVPRGELELGPLELSEVAEILRSHRPGLSDSDIERIADVSHGNPLYLRGVVSELETNPRFDLRELPRDVEDYFRTLTRRARSGSSELLRDSLGLLCAARKSLSLTELGQLTGGVQRIVFDQAIRPVRPCLIEVEGGYSFYHARFHEFVRNSILGPDELPSLHSRIADWLLSGRGAPRSYRRASLARHLFEAGRYDELTAAIDEAFLEDKLKHDGYAVLEDVELIARSLLERSDPALVARCVELVERLRGAVGGQVVDDARHSLQTWRPGLAAFRERTIAPPLNAIAGVEVYAAMLPKGEVGADFFDAIPAGGSLTTVIGDAPGIGLKSAFVARFLCSMFRRFIQEDEPGLAASLAALNQAILPHEFFEPTSMQCARVVPSRRVVALASAGHPFPVLYSTRRKACDRLPIRGELLHAATAGREPPRFEQRRSEFHPGDVLVMVTDGLTEGHKLRGEPYGYRFSEIVTARAAEPARAICEAILDDWNRHPRDGDHADDVTVVVVKNVG